MASSRPFGNVRKLKSGRYQAHYAVGAIPHPVLADIVEGRSVAAPARWRPECTRLN